jgi:hypothetical protein
VKKVRKLEEMLLHLDVWFAYKSVERNLMLFDGLARLHSLINCEHTKHFLVLTQDMRICNTQRDKWSQLLNKDMVSSPI